MHAACISRSAFSEGAIYFHRTYVDSRQNRKSVSMSKIGDAMRIAQDNMDSRNFYGYNPEFDRTAFNPSDRRKQCN